LRTKSREAGRLGRGKRKKVGSREAWRLGGWEAGKREKKEGGKVRG